MLKRNRAFKGDQITRHLFPVSENEMLANDVNELSKKRSAFNASKYICLAESLRRIKVVKKKGMSST